MLRSCDGSKPSELDPPTHKDADRGSVPRADHSAAASSLSRRSAVLRGDLESIFHHRWQRHSCSTAPRTVIVRPDEQHRRLGDAASSSATKPQGFRPALAAALTTAGDSGRPRIKKRVGASAKRKHQARGLAAGKQYIIDTHLHINPHLDTTQPSCCPDPASSPRPSPSSSSRCRPRRRPPPPASPPSPPSSPLSSRPRRPRRRRPSSSSPSCCCRRPPPPPPP